ncbi:MAG: PD-(D/E)XK nuclease family protein, partial [Alistipes sp.]|nr:PD-(D/E)XK nuclease family protein [Alistipes sp.]
MAATGFLEEVARDLHARYGAELSERTVLFPSRRARLFFTDALRRIVGHPVWEPAWSTIDELTSEISGLETGDRLRLIAELYKVYSQFHDEPFDKFYFWGEMLLNDFDTIDKYRIDAAQLFRNLSDIKEIEADISYLTPAQLQILSFWSSLGPEADLSQEKQRFLAIWKTLGPVYERYRARLGQLGIAYGGMVQRAAAEKIEAGKYAFPEPRRYVVAGF